MNDDFRKILIGLLIFAMIVAFISNLKQPQVRLFSYHFNDPFAPKERVYLSSRLERSVREDLRKSNSPTNETEFAQLVNSSIRDLREYGFNVELSKRISYIHGLPDVRNEQCKELSYQKSGSMRASVIVIFENTPISLLLRTLYSIIERTDAALLQEVILVDGGSTQTELRDKLRYYVSTRFSRGTGIPVRLERIEKPVGISESRLIGARLATGEVLIFMDGYCQPNVGWLEPLMQRIAESPQSVVMPVMDEINAIYLQYREKPTTIGGFSWNGEYYMEPVSKKRLAAANQTCQQPLPTCPIESPVIPPGHVYAITHKQFNYLATNIDTVLHTEGDTLEMSFSIWLCSGKIEVLPCSRVGRISLDRSFKGLPTSTLFDRGNAAVGWWEWRQRLFFYFYPIQDLSIDLFDPSQEKLGGVRDKIGCKNFDWFLKHVYPEKMTPSELATKYGRIKSPYGNQCLSDQLRIRPEAKNSLTVENCQAATNPAFLFFFTKTKQLRSEFNCMVAKNEDPTLVELVSCIDIPEKYLMTWQLDQNSISMKVGSRALCLEVANIVYPVLNECDPQRKTQYWVLEGIDRNHLTPIDDQSIQNSQTVKVDQHESVVLIDQMIDKSSAEHLHNETTDQPPGQDFEIYKELDENLKVDSEEGNGLSNQISQKFNETNIFIMKLWINRLDKISKFIKN
ncbi:polypeptide N-acetylgalactosaminyltransferase 1-like [Scaptodrosophila lebanonensis]|uniref:Polypeptide N-acetylgalactosaminyltransferase n=1 Tax=Drosophila lebanonensis TaxID=7225 RepID=A0A6J2U2B9_DROLE|nr:polypeptide N-acetylgalactosaminyltransferase 1-like [Scaptodrosophila lebanonensis]